MSEGAGVVGAHLIGERIRRLRLVAGLCQIEFAERIGVATGSVSKLENGRMTISDGLLSSISRVLDCSPHFLRAHNDLLPSTRPWLRAYADASKHAVDRQIADCTTVTEVAGSLGLTTIPDTVPAFRGDLTDDEAIEQFAIDLLPVRSRRRARVVGRWSPMFGSRVRKSTLEQAATRPRDDEKQGEVLRSDG